MSQDFSMSMNIQNSGSNIIINSNAIKQDNANLDKKVNNNNEQIGMNNFEQLQRKEAEPENNSKDIYTSIENIKSKLADAKENLASAKINRESTNKTFPLLGRIFGGILAVGAAIAATLVAVATLPVSLPICIGLGAAFIAGATIFGIAQHEHNQNKNFDAQIANQETNMANLQARFDKIKIVADNPQIFDPNSRFDEYKSLQNLNSHVDKVIALAERNDCINIDVPKFESSEAINYKGDKDIDFNCQFSQKELTHTMFHYEHLALNDLASNEKKFVDDIGRCKITIGDNFISEPEHYENKTDKQQVIEEATQQISALTGNDQEITQVIQGLANQKILLPLVFKMQNVINDKLNVISSVGQDNHEISISKTADLGNFKQFQITSRMQTKQNIVEDNSGNKLNTKIPSGDMLAEVKLNVNVKILDNGQKQFAITLAEPMTMQTSFKTKQA